MHHLPAGAQSALDTDQVIDITTIGRHSGQPRRIEIWFLNFDGTIYIVGAPGRRDWYANLVANPSFVFHLKQSVEHDLNAVATVVDDPAERQRVLAEAVRQWELGADTFDESTKRAPVVRITFPA